MWRFSSLPPQSRESGQVVAVVRSSQPLTPTKQRVDSRKWFHVKTERVWFLVLPLPAVFFLIFLVFFILSHRAATWSFYGGFRLKLVKWWCQGYFPQFCTVLSSTWVLVHFHQDNALRPKVQIISDWLWEPQTQLEVHITDIGESTSLMTKRIFNPESEVFPQ